MSEDRLPNSTDSNASYRNIINKLIDELAAQRRMTEAAMAQTDRALRQIERLVSMADPATNGYIRD